MAKGRDIKRRIRSIGSMLQVTKAMELIASIKMKKAQDKAMQSKAYVFESWRAITRLARLKENQNNPLLNERRDGKILCLVISSDRGLAGSFNGDIMRKTLKFIEENGVENIDFITMGSKIKSFIRKVRGNIIADFPLGENIRFTMTSPIALIAWEGYQKEKYKKFVSIHTHFESAARKNATVLQIMPLDPSILDDSDTKSENIISGNSQFRFEPNREIIFSTILRHTVRALTYQVILESEAAEHASRMIAMKNASDAAGDLKEDFEFTYNQLRQQSITAELAEISAGAIAQE